MKVNGFITALLISGCSAIPAPPTPTDVEKLVEAHLSEHIAPIITQANARYEEEEIPNIAFESRVSEIHSDGDTAFDAPITLIFDPGLQTEVSLSDTVKIESTFFHSWRVREESIQSLERYCAIYASTRLNILTETVIETIVIEGFKQQYAHASSLHLIEDIPEPRIDIIEINEIGDGNYNVKLTLSNEINNQPDSTSPLTMIFGKTAKGLWKVMDIKANPPKSTEENE